MMWAICRTLGGVWVTGAKQAIEDWRHRSENADRRKLRSENADRRKLSFSGVDERRPEKVKRI